MEFNQQMQNLADEAQSHQSRLGQSAVAHFDSRENGMEMIGSTLAENREALERLEAAVESQGKTAGDFAEIRNALFQKSSLTQQLFDALHAELKGYRDGALIEGLQKPLILDVIGIYDEMSRLHGQMERETSSLANRPDYLKTLDHLQHHVLEILARVGVTKHELLTGKFDKTLQRATSREETENPEEDGCVARSLKPGFEWRERILRPEEVTVKKWPKPEVMEESETKEILANSEPE